MKTFLLYAVTAIAEILGCYLPWRWLKDGGSAWLLVPGALSLAAFAWLLTLHGAAAGRVYAAYGGVYITASLLWLRLGLCVWRRSLRQDSRSGCGSNRADRGAGAEG